MHLPERGETPPFNPVEVFSYDIDRLKQLGEFFDSAWELVQDTDRCNEYLALAGRADLCITNPAEMKSITNINDIIGNPGDNFKTYWWIPTHVPKAPDNWTPPSPIATSITAEQLKQLASGEIDDSIVKNGHRVTEMHLRMLVLFPDFSKDLIQILSSQTYPYYSDHRHELFIAYQLASQLVDQSDLYVIRNGQVNGNYLCD